MLKKTRSLLTLVVFVLAQGLSPINFLLTQGFIPMNYVLAENNDVEDFQVEENIDEDYSGDILDMVDDGLVDDIQNDEQDEIKGEENEVDSELDVAELEETEAESDDGLLDEVQDDEQNEIEGDEHEIGSEFVDTEDDEGGIEGEENGTGSGIIEDMQDDEENITETQAGSGEDSIDQLPENQDNEDDENNGEEGIQGIIDAVSDGVNEVINKIRYFFNRAGDTRYLKYNRDENNIGIITLKDPETSASITIMDKNLGAGSAGVGTSSYGYYFQWGNNHGVVDTSNRTTKKAVYEDSYYNHGYDGDGLFIVGSSDYWEGDAHYNSLWGSESKEYTRQAACPAGYHVPTIKEWNKLLSIWGKIHTQDESTNENGANSLRRYITNFSTSSMHTFKSAATQCAEGDTECVDEDKLSDVVEILSSELKLPIAGSYDENGNFHDGLGVYWTTTTKGGNKAGVFSVDAYIGRGGDETLLYKAQGHNIRCFKNVEKMPETNEDNSSVEQSELQTEAQGEPQIEPQGEIQENGDENGLFAGVEEENASEQQIGSGEDSSEDITKSSEDITQLENQNITGVQTYIVTWRNEDGTVRDITTVPYGQKPTHDNIEQPADEQYTYVFAGWEPEISEATGDAEYTAKYMYVLNQYNVTWENSDGTVLKSEKVGYGAMPSYNGEIPVKASDGGYDYTFAGWEPAVSVVRGDIIYKATYTKIHPIYTIIRENSDGTVLKSDETEYGSMPSYDGENPEKQSDGIYSYEFSGWEPEISEVTGDMVYIAKYHTIEIEKEIEGEDSDDQQPFSSLDTSSDDKQNFENGDNNDVSLGGNGGYVGSEETVGSGEVVEEGDEGFWTGIWETLKSFFLEDEDGYFRGSETIDDVIVSVEAEEGTFPVGTQVIIKGVPQNRLEQIQTSLIEDETNNVTEDAQILAFDISFVYSGEEIQPLKEVSVKFNYKENTDFQGASELSVYHIDDETAEGTEIQVASKEGDEIEILATEFSVYVLALTENNSITLTLDPGDGVIITGGNIIVNEQGIGTITSVDGNVILPNATQADHVFVGWYTSQTSSLQTFAGSGGNQYQVNSDITLYAKWCNDGYVINTEQTACILPGNLKTIMDQNPNFTYGQIGILRPDGWANNGDPSAIVIMDRNLGASSFGTNNSAWGYYYQYGNNYGLTEDSPKISRSQADVNLTLYGPSNPYYSGVFVLGPGTNFWPTTANYDIWGFQSGDEEDRQGPCPVGWHIPTIEEWNKAISYWTGNNGGMNVSAIRAELGLPLPGGLTRSNGVIEKGGTNGRFRTVSLILGKQEKVYELEVTNKSINGNYSENIVNARQIRCFMNTDQMLNKFTVMYTDGVDDREIFEDQVYSGLSLGDLVPVFSGEVSLRTGNNGSVHEFIGWSLSGTDELFDVSGARVTQDMVLNVKWSGCFDGEAENANGECVPTAETQRDLQIVQDLDLYFLVSDEDKKHYTIMDRNMGATAVYNKNYKNANTASLGYLYQWGNNYGFPARGDLAEQGVFTSTSQVPKSIWSQGIPSKYASMTYYLSGVDHVSWMEDGGITDGIWGGTGDTLSAEGSNTTLEGRQGPCPVGYHVPSIVERQNLFMDWSGSNMGVSQVKVDGIVDAVYKLSEDLLLPPAGRRAINGAIAGDYAKVLSYWSSSPATGSDRAAGFYGKADDRIEVRNFDGRARARSVRCVKNTVNTRARAIVTEDIYLDGGVNAVISIDNGVISTLGSPTRTDSTFDGWYTTSDFSGNPLATGDTVQAGSSLYAKFTCDESGYVWNGTTCEDGVRLYFDSMGGTEVPSQLVESGGIGVRPADPTKTGYVFSGWFLTGAIEEFNFTGTIITGNTTLYAHWNTGEYEVSIVSNNINYGTVDEDSVTAEYLSPITTNGNILTIGTETITATPVANGAEYTYIFSGWTNTCGETVTTGCTVTANFDRIGNSYTVTINAAPEGYGSVDSGTVTASYGTSITTNENILTIGTETITATSTASGVEYTYIFSGWINTCGETVTTGCTITANFDRITNEYIVSFDSNGGNYTPNDQSVPYGSTASKPIPDPTKDSYTFGGWMLNGIEFKFFTPITGSINLVAEWIDETKPIVILTSKTNTVNATGQAATLKCSDVAGVTAYYWGTTEPMSANDMTTTTSLLMLTSASGLDQTVSTAGTYYLGCRDEAGNFEVQSLTYSQYQVKNMLDRIIGTTGIYTTNNYDVDSIMPTDGIYIILSGTSLTLSEMCTTPTISSTRKITSVGEPSELSANDTLIDTITSNTTYACWFDRDTYHLNLVINTGIDTIYYKVNGASSFVSTGETSIINGVKAGSQIQAYAIPKAGYTYNETSSSNPWTVTSVTGDNVFSPVATATTVEYTVYHYVKRVGENTYVLSKTETSTGTTDATVIFSSLAKESEFLCAHYSSGSLTGTESGPGEIVTQTTIKGDGSTEIYLYYVRNYYRVTLSGDEHVDYLEINGERREEATLECGSNVPVDAIPKTGYHFVRWEEREREERRESKK